MSTLTARPSSGAAAARARGAAQRVGPRLPLTLALAAALCVVAFTGGGGLAVGQVTWVEIGLTLGGALLAAAALVLAPPGDRQWGGATAGLFAAFAILTVLSILWSVDPADTWLEADRTFAYLASFVAGIALVRVAPGRLASLLGAVLLATLVVSAYALASHVFPGTIGGDDFYARLREPFSYWNAVGVMAAMGIPAAMWLGARRESHGVLAALAFPAVALLMIVTFLSFSRGSLLALAVGCAVWLILVPLRLRGTAVLLGGGALGAAVVAWAFEQPALTQDLQPLADRTAAGHELGLFTVLAMLAALVLGLAIGFLRARRAPSHRLRRRAGIALLCALACVPVGLAAYLFTTPRGFGGSISHAVSTLVNPDAAAPANTPSRLAATSSVRARYWREAGRIFTHHPLLGTGAGGYATARLRYRHDQLEVQHAHGYIVQTMADLGAVGLAITLALLAAWLAATLRSTALRRRDRATPFTPERIGLLTLLAVVVTFGVHSLIDWTWFVPGVAVTALVCAGWLAGRGPLRRPAGARAPVRPAPRISAARAVATGGVLAVAVVVAYATWQPLRSADAADAALLYLSQGNVASALETNSIAMDRDPLDVGPYFDRAVIDVRAGNKAAGEQALRSAVALQPANPVTWLRLGEYQLNVLSHAGQAEATLAAAVYLDPNDDEALEAWLAAERLHNYRAHGGANAAPSGASAGS